MGSGTLLRWIQHQVASDQNGTERPLSVVANDTVPEPEPAAARASTCADDAIAGAKDLVVAVGSKNPVKVEATRRAFQSVFSDSNIVVVPTLRKDATGNLRTGVSNHWENSYVQLFC